MDYNCEIQGQFLTHTDPLSSPDTATVVIILHHVYSKITCWSECCPKTYNKIKL